MLTNEGFFGCLFSRTTKRGGPVLRTGPERPEWRCVHLFMSNWIAEARMEVRECSSPKIYRPSLLWGKIGICCPLTIPPPPPALATSLGL